jgi:hypothetical protein
MLEWFMIGLAWGRLGLCDSSARGLDEGDVLLQKAEVRIIWLRPIQTSGFSEVVV